MATRSNLVRYGITPTIIDDRSDKTSTGRADGLQPKTIETFKQLGLADTLLKKGVKIYDICFWVWFSLCNMPYLFPSNIKYQNSTATTALHRTRREIHYPPEVDVIEPYILLVHQGMIEDIFIEDLRDRGVEVIRSSPFLEYSLGPDSKAPLEIVCNGTNGSTHSLKTKYLVGCDGARSMVRKSIPSAEMEGESSRAPWGVLDGQSNHSCNYKSKHLPSSSSPYRLTLITQVSLKPISLIFGAKLSSTQMNTGRSSASLEKEI
jgi:phenol 2-monooxygenase